MLNIVAELDYDYFSSSTILLELVILHSHLVSVSDLIRYLKHVPSHQHDEKNSELTFTINLNFNVKVFPTKNIIQSSSNSQNKQYN